ncbi:SGNH/GDSL hydrolase family protein [Metabacillus sediminilitoris]|uniref:SGNH/GDSL hydrolase family protein n=1 Tax=Metabacillus sediminilitoris TaxID=2567941 RepID=A0A4S4C199_9BACI|nr:SGNH/GDSL hydrolase family protein [Metabacillus sediminilitoris]QGQ48218.1 hypothetical protein GMB29_24915 [Metabacillus sediminilitoris]THF81423.1 SGNH/GDSL hydrolase family protein [Metabacillus sediminilitoris]
MGKLICIVTVLVCAGSIIVGNIHWNNKISAKAEMVENYKEPAVIEENVMGAEIPIKEVEEKESDLSTYTQNLPEQLQKKIQHASTSGKPVHLVIYGSESTSAKKGAWPELLRNQLRSTYGEKVIKVTVISEGDKTSIDVLRSKSYENVSKQKPDVVLFEPFTLKDNSGKIPINNRLGSIEDMIDSWKTANKAVTILLQPANPIYGATYYPKQINELKEFVKKHNIAFIDHWGNWPNGKDKKIKNYLTPTSMPNENGNKVWSQYLIDYFVAK